jgi:UDP-2,3-diacylglucosamine pyrophosphatase LpxH
MFIDACLRKYKKVEFINVPGNHDDILGRAIGSYVWQLYRDNPRITVQKGDSPFQYVKRGKVLLGFAHGHTCKLSSLPGKMADDQFKLWGKTTYRHWITGHVHHNSWTQFKEHPGCKVETVGIIPPKDAYAHGGAYGAARGIQGIIFDKKVGYSPKRIEETVRAND